MQQHLVLGRADRRRIDDGDLSHVRARDLEREPPPGLVGLGRVAVVVGGRRVGRLSGGRQQDVPVSLTDAHGACRHPRLGHEHLGDLPGDLLDIDRAREHGAQLLEAVQQRELVAHLLLQHAVLDGQRDPIGDGAQLGRVGGLERLGSPAPEDHEPDRLGADHEADPRDVARPIARQPRGERPAAGRVGAHRLRPDEALDRGQGERSGGACRTRRCPSARRSSDRRRTRA